MKSIKPGRGPSFMGGIMSICMGLFGLLWTVIVAGAGGGIFALFGVIFIGIAIAQAFFHFKNATGKNRYSTYDITDSEEEPDPLNEHYGNTVPKKSATTPSGKHSSEFCPYCGVKVEDAYSFCNKCGKKLP